MMEGMRERNIPLGDEIGRRARVLDSEMSAFERMKIKKSTIYRLAAASLVYAGSMALMAAFL
ncbi:hypothetical protein AKJ58_00725 [candidate division MSBL1 archaeon SCGC-AAA385D11]|uniref:Uncharacterized protein n=1 Tax=candidate division MSBL1 archaeon SCGC-AAA385D11 TaxID=1698286 RepID=A0A133VNY3_9EURY|nr:hypothetical protein AKJ58_00725 [candidate division MSBL1 archaeon SCGC-AAA385D11]